MAGEGFRLVAEDTLAPLPNPRWMWWGGVYERERASLPHHWSAHRATPGLWLEPW